MKSYDEIVSFLATTRYIEGSIFPSVSSNKKPLTVDSLSIIADIYNKTSTELFVDIQAIANNGL